MPKVLLYYLIASALFVVFGFGFLILAPRLLALNPPSSAVVPATQHVHPHLHVHSTSKKVATATETKSAPSAASQQAKWAMAAIRQSHNEAILETKAAAKSTQKATTRRDGELRRRSGKERGEQEG